MKKFGERPPVTANLPFAANNGTPQTIARKQQQCVSNFYNSKLGNAVQFGSPPSLLPGWNPAWGNNLKEWRIAIFGKLGGLFGSGGMTGTTQLAILSGTTTVGSPLELGTEATLGTIEKVATPAMGVQQSSTSWPTVLARWRRTQLPLTQHCNQFRRA